MQLSIGFVTLRQLLSVCLLWKTFPTFKFANRTQEKETYAGMEHLPGIDKSRKKQQECHFPAEVIAKGVSRREPQLLRFDEKDESIGF